MAQTNAPLQIALPAHKTNYPAIEFDIDWPDEVLVNYGLDHDKKLAVSVDFVAQIIAVQFQPHWRYEGMAKTWYRWDGRRWAEANHILNDIVYGISLLRKGWIGQRIQNLKNLSDPTFAPYVKGRLEANTLLRIDTEQLDSYPHFLNTAIGVVDLRSGMTYQHSPELLLTQIIEHDILDDEDGKLCPNYMAHLKLITAGDQIIMDYLEDLSGYFLTGEINQQQFYAAHGLGNNGKGALFETWAQAMGAYACQIAQGQFSHEGKTQHKEADLRLRGKRLAIGDETRNWDMDKLKMFTGGMAITARGMGKGTVQYKPTAKLVFICNQKPAINDNTYGARRRLRLIEFNNRIDDALVDPDFISNKILPELPYILNRMIAHALKFYTNKRIQTPDKIMQASSDYFASEDVMGQFIKECCEEGKYNSEPFFVLFSAFQTWVLKNGFDELSKNQFGRLLSNMGFGKGFGGKEGERSRLITGVKLRVIHGGTAEPAESSSQSSNNDME